MTDFRKIEEEVVSAYKDLPARINNKIKTKSKFYFLDGPPFVTNEIHQGTLYTYFIKDSILRYKILQGFDVRIQPGWDTQGLPIEIKVQEKLKLNSKKEIENIGIDKFIQECKTFVNDLIARNTNIFIKSGIFMHLFKPYITYENQFISGVWGVIKKAYEESLLEKGWEPTWYCTHCETPMANYETKDSYIEKEDNSLFFLLKLKDSDDYLLVWTTTPWTIPANVAVAVNAEEDYEEIKIENRNIIIAKKREDLLKKYNIAYTVLRVFKGKELLGKHYFHPFADLPLVKDYVNKDNFNIVIDGSAFKGELDEPFVNVEEGTGIVHVAPGHGISDYAISREYSLPILSPVDNKGEYTQEAGWLAGKTIWEGNNLVIEYLKEKGLLFLTQKIRHKYPVCWRCKNPLITRASEQWFLRVKRIKNQLIELVEKINWVPSSSKEMMKNWLEGINDWVISRQRYWGAPLPIWTCENNHIYVVGSKEELERLSNKNLEDLHRPYIDEITFPCPSCKKEMKRVQDTLDVWIDSGSASFASLGGEHTEEFNKWYPADFITEGHDQIRGWFYSLLVLGYVYKKDICYKNVLMHRFVVGEDKQKLSKSLGNYIPLNEFYSKGYSADALRLSMISKSMDDNIVYKLKDVEDYTKVLNVLINLGKLYEEILKFENNLKSEKIDSFKEIYNKWIIYEWVKSKRAIVNALDSYKLSEATNIFIDFLVNEFSQNYLKIAKDDIFYRDSYESAFVTKNIIKELIIYSSIFAPLTADYLNLNLFSKKFTLEEYLPDPDRFAGIDLSDDYQVASEKMINSLHLLSELLRVRNELHINLRRTIKEIIILDENLKDSVDLSIISRLANIKKLTFSQEVPNLNNYKLIGKIAVDDSLDNEILKEWEIREISRIVQDMRKKAGLKREEKAIISITNVEKEVIEAVLQKTNSREGTGSIALSNKININNKEIEINLYR
ncbi:MAG: isoleucine--tRNA ligase [Candidatus Parvarchaeota archaeon]|nr:isoleucine--tRNA ligase [Candidatus Rehaiarchaeum fermentans]